MSKGPDTSHFRVALDLQACQTEGSRDRGIGRYSRSLTEALVRSQRDLHFTLALNDGYPDSAEELVRGFAPIVGEANCVRYDAAVPWAPWGVREPDGGRLAGEWIAEQVWLAQKPDLIHINSVFEGFHGKAVVPSLTALSRNTVLSATAYDLIPLIFSDIYLAERATREWYHSRIARLRRCDVLLAISESTRSDVVERLGIAPECVVNVGGAADPRFSAGSVTPARKAELLGRLGIDGPYVMYTGGIDHRKNVDALIRAYAGLPPGARDAHQLAIVCNLQDVDSVRLRELARQCRLPERALVLTGFVSDADLVDLCRCCHLFVFPSLYEGFGLPVLEAMSCGAPTIAAATSSLTEIVGRTDALFDIGSDDAIGAALHRALTDTDFRVEIAMHGLRQSRQYSWPATAARAREAWDDALARKRARAALAPAAPRPRLALVTPLLPERSGIADYVTELLPYLAQHFEIDLFASADADAERYRNAGFAVHAWQLLPGCWLDYDGGVVHQFGNSSFHAHQLALLEACPGTVLLHDAYLSGLMHYMEQGPPGVAALFRNMLDYAHGDEGVSCYERLGRETTIDRYPMSRWVADHATGVVVTSRHARHMLQECGQLDYARCSVVPLQFATRSVSPAQRAAARKSLGLADDAILVTSFGHVHARKCSLELVDAWSTIAISPKARLVFVGEAAGGYGAALRERAADSPRCESIVVTGYVSDEDFHRYLQACDVIVQLRGGSRGESSAAMLYAMAYGLPAIASRHGSLEEIPDDACLHVDSPVDIAQLAGAIESLTTDAGRRAVLGKRALEWIRGARDPARGAGELASIIASYNNAGVMPADLRLRYRAAAVSRGVPRGPRSIWIERIVASASACRPPRLEDATAQAISASIRALLPALDLGPMVEAQPRADAPEVGPALVLLAGHPRLATRCGTKSNDAIRTNSAGGMLMHGPYAGADAGRYRVRVYGEFLPDEGNHDAIVEAAAKAGMHKLATQVIAPLPVSGSHSPLITTLDFTCVERVEDLEIRIRVPAGAHMTIECLEIVRIE
ncbi:MAG: glycosyltransferase [Betaproteobacteria bacterium]